MTQNRKFRQYVRALAADHGLDYAEALKLANSNKTATSFTPTFDSAGVFQLGKILPTPIGAVSPEISAFVTGGVGHGKSTEYAQWTPHSEPHLRIVGAPGAGKTLFAKKLVRAVEGRVKSAVVSSRPDEWAGVTNTAGHVSTALEIIEEALSSLDPVDAPSSEGHEQCLLVIDTENFDDLDAASKNLVQVILRVGRSWHCHLVLIGVEGSSYEAEKEIELTTQPLTTRLELETDWIADFKGDRFRF